MSDGEDLKPLLIEIRDIVLRHEEVNRRDADFRKRVLFALLFALAIAVVAMGYALFLVHTTTREIRQRQEQMQPQKVANLSTWHVDQTSLEGKKSFSSRPAKIFSGPKRNSLRV